MRKNLLLLTTISFGLFTFLNAQEKQPTGVLWQDDFNDTAEDPSAFSNLGWARFFDSQGLVGATVGQRDDNLYLQSGIFQFVVGAGIALTNGTPTFDTSDTSGTEAALLKNDYSSPNQVMTFRFNLEKITPEKVTLFVLATRILQSPKVDTVAFTVGDMQNSPAYTFSFDALQDTIAVARYDAPLQAIAPATWSYFGKESFAFEDSTWYWAKCYLYEGDMKLKVWSGEKSEEPEGWLLEGSDAEPRVGGQWTAFGLLGLPPGAGETGDIVRIDDVTMEGFDPTTSVAEDVVSPQKFHLAQNYPNPFNPETEISFALDSPGQTTLEVFTIIGQKVRTLVNANLNAGEYRLRFNARDDAGRSLSSGVYFYKLRHSSGLRSTKKMLLLR